MVINASLGLVRPKPEGLSPNQEATPILRPLVIDGVRVRPRAAREDALLKAGLGADPHTNAIHVRAGEVPVAHTCNTAPPMGVVASSARVPCVARPARPVRVDHEVPTRLGRPNGRAAAGLPGPLPVDEAPYVLVLPAVAAGASARRLGAPIPKLARVRVVLGRAAAVTAREVLRSPSGACRTSSPAFQAAVLLLVPAAALPRRAVSVCTRRAFAGGPAADLVQVLGVPSPGSPAALGDGALLLRKAVHEAPDVPATPISRSRAPKAGAAAYALRRALVVLTIPGRVLSA